MFSEAADDADPDIAVTLLGSGETIGSGSASADVRMGGGSVDPGTSVFGIRNPRVDPFTAVSSDGPIPNHLGLEIHRQVERRAEWVSAPTLIRSTPVAAQAPTVARLIPPDASSRIDGATAIATPDGLGHALRAEVVHQDDVGSASQGGVELLERVNLHLDHRAGRHVGPRRRDRRGDGSTRPRRPPPPARPGGCP